MIEDSIDGHLLVAWLQKHNPDVNWKTGQVKWRSPYFVENCLPKQVNTLLVDEARLVKEVHDCTDAFKFVATIAWRMEDGLDLLKVLPIDYYKWARIFSREQTNTLPSYSSYHHHIKLVEGAEAP